MRKFFLSLIFLCSIFYSSFAQPHFTLEEQLKFNSYLFEKHLFSENNLLLTETEKIYSLSPIQRDSFNFIRAICFSKLVLDDSAAHRFAIVSVHAPNYDLCQLNAALKFTVLNKMDESKKLILNYQTNDTSQRQLRNFYLNSVLLLNKDLGEFEKQTSQKEIANTYFTNRNEELKKFEVQIKKANKKSPLLAGMMSAIIPGTGKIYSGKWRQGLISMVPLTVMGLQAYEAYRIDGIKSARFIVFGGIFSVFYIGNIYGSAVSVSVRKKEIEHEVHDEVVLSLHISLQHVFGQSY